MESNKDKKEEKSNITDFWKRSNHELLDGDKLNQIKESAKAIRENQDDSYDKAKVAALVEQMNGMFVSTTATDSHKINKAFYVLYNLVKTNIIMTKTPNDVMSGANYNNFGLELLDMFKKHYLPTVKDYSPVTKTKWRKEEAEVDNKERAKKAKSILDQDKTRKAKNVLERKSVEFLLKHAVDAHFKEIDRAEKELPIDDETKTIIETARQILQKINEEHEICCNQKNEKAEAVLNRLEAEVKKELKEKRFNEFLNRTGIDPSLEQAEKKAKSEAQESLFDKIASKDLRAIVKPPWIGRLDKEAFTDLLKAAEADDDFKVIVHEEDED